MADLVTGNFGVNGAKTHSIFLGNGDHAFPDRSDIPAGVDYGLLIADVNGDGRPDLAGTDVDAGTVSVSLGHGDGTFRRSRSYAVGNRPIWLATGDLNQDGSPDLVSANSAESTLGVLLGPFGDDDSPTVPTPRMRACTNAFSTSLMRV